MKIDRVKYTAHYDEFGTLKDQWIGLEGQIDDTEVPENKLDEIKAITERWYRKQNPQLYPDGTTPPAASPTVIRTERTSEDVIVSDLIRNIYACTQLDGDNGLWTYSKLSSTYKEAQAAYCVMENKLRNQEVKQILDATNALTDSLNADPELKKQFDDYNKNTRIKKDKNKGGYQETLDDNK